LAVFVDALFPFRAPVLDFEIGAVVALERASIGHRRNPPGSGSSRYFHEWGTTAIIARRRRDAQSLRPLDTRPGMRVVPRAEPSVSTHGHRARRGNLAGAVAGRVVVAVVLQEQQNEFDVPERRHAQL
jgi:hypothetical protein